MKTAFFEMYRCTLKLQPGYLPAVKDYITNGGLTQIRDGELSVFSNSHSLEVIVYIGATGHAKEATAEIKGQDECVVDGFAKGLAKTIKSKFKTNMHYRVCHVNEAKHGKEVKRMTTANTLPHSITPSCLLAPDNDYLDDWVRKKAE